MDFNYICAILVRDPYYLTIEDIKKLTPYQVQRIYGKAPTRPSPPPSSFGIPTAPY